MSRGRGRGLFALALVALSAQALVAPGCGSDDSPAVPPGDGGGDGTATPDGTTGNDASGQGDASTSDVTLGDAGSDAWVIPPGGVVLPGGGVLLPDGGIMLADGGVIPVPPGGVVLPDGGIYLPDGGVTSCVPSTCQGKTYECGDCVDNDGDGKIDMKDNGCLGPCDDSEEDLSIGIPGNFNDPCSSDCYYDSNSGAGDDKCEWNLKCDPHETPPNYYPRASGPNGDQCAYNWTGQISGNTSWCQEHYVDGGQPKACGDFCAPLTPNGCDCFGCCTFPALSGLTEAVQPPGVEAGAPRYVFLGSEYPDGGTSCTIDAVNDPTRCHPCTPVKACLNTCETCELCIGKTALPAECYPKPPPVADGGVPTDGGILLPDGGVVPVPEGGVILPDGGLYLPDGATVSPDSGTAPPVCGGQLCFGAQACGLDCQPPCPSGQFCLTGCCTANPK
jgi:hypothetical protein